MKTPLLLLLSLTFALTPSFAAESRSNDLVKVDPAIKRQRLLALRAYAKLVAALRVMPTRDELLATVRPTERDGLFGEGGLFKDMDALEAATREALPKAFEKAVDRAYFTDDYRAGIQTAIRTHKRLIVTTAIAGVPVEESFLKALKVYAKKNDAAILVIPMGMITSNLSPLLTKDPEIHILVEGVRLTDNITIDPIKLMVKQLKHLQGLDRLGNKGDTVIIASPHFEADTVPTTASEHRNQIMFTTGAITLPDYQGTHYIGERTEHIAMKLHKMGALVLERAAGPNSLGALQRGVGDYHIRRLEYIGLGREAEKPWAEQEKGFADLDRFYTAEGDRPIRNEALVLGDLHISDLNPKVAASLRELILKVRPKTLVLHDFFNGSSINHHEEEKHLSLLDRARAGKLDLGKELSQAAQFINSLLEIDPQMKITVVKSNHDHWLYRWIERGEGEYVGAQNADIRNDLARLFPRGAYMRGTDGASLGFTKDPIEYALKNGVRIDPYTGSRGNTVLRYPNRVRFMQAGTGGLRVGDEFRDSHLVQIGDHGDVGPNGSKGGGVPAWYRAETRIVFGHTHAEIKYFNDTVNIGSLTYRRAGYNNSGASSWGESVAIVTQYGQIQPLLFRNGHWFQEDLQDPGLESETFFGPEMPLVREARPAKAATDAGVDQYSRRPPPVN